MTLLQQVTKFFQSKVAEFFCSEDPMYEMLSWLLHQFMKAEAESKVGAEKNQHSTGRKTYFSGYKIREHHTSFMYASSFSQPLNETYSEPKLKNEYGVPLFQFLKNQFRNMKQKKLEIIL